MALSSTLPLTSPCLMTIQNPRCLAPTTCPSTLQMYTRTTALLLSSILSTHKSWLYKRIANRLPARWKNCRASTTESLWARSAPTRLNAKNRFEPPSLGLSSRNLERLSISNSFDSLATCSQLQKRVLTSMLVS